MSFIFENKELINKFIQAGFAFEQKFKKSAQGGPRLDVDLQGIKEDLLNQLVSPTATIGTDLDQDVDITAGNFTDINNLIQFLTTNKITVDGARATFLANEAPADRRGLAVRTIANNTYYINTTLLTSYLQSLKNDADRINNAVLSKQVTRLLNEARSSLKIELPSTSASGAAGTAGATGAAATGTQPSGQAAGRGAATTQGAGINDIINLSRYRPLQNDYINVLVISKFVDDFTKQIISQDTTGAMSGLVESIQDIRTALSTLKNISPNRSQFIINMQTTAEDIARIVKAPLDVNYKAFIKCLSDIVTGVRDMLRSFYEAYSNTKGVDMDNVERQAIGGSSSAQQLLDNLARLDSAGYKV